MRIRNSWLALLLIALLYLVSNSAWEVKCDAVAELLFMVGVILAGAGAMGRLWCSAYIAGYKNATLVTEGPYSICRNPLYFFSFIGGIGIGMATETFTIPILVGSAFALYYPFTIKKEEAYLRSLYSESFDAYVQRVPRFIPSLRLLVEKNEGQIHLVLFRRHILSAIWFVWLPAFAEGIEFLHDTKVLPCFFSLY